MKFTWNQVPLCKTHYMYTEQLSPFNHASVFSFALWLQNWSLRWHSDTVVNNFLVQAVELYIIIYSSSSFTEKSCHCLEALSQEHRSWCTIVPPVGRAKTYKTFLSDRHADNWGMTQKEKQSPVQTLLHSITTTLPICNILVLFPSPVQL